MVPYFTKTVHGPFAAVVEAVKAALAEEGFGVITEVDMQSTLKAKIGADFRPYLILGTCSPEMAYAVLQVDARAGALLPCNVVVQTAPAGGVEIIVLNPVAAMQILDNADLVRMASVVSGRLQKVVDRVEDLHSAA